MIIAHYITQLILFCSEKDQKNMDSFQINVGSLETLLSNTYNHNNDVRKEAENILMESITYDGCLKGLLETIQVTAITEVKQASSLLLKNFAKSHWSSDSREQEKVFKC